MEEEETIYSIYYVLINDSTSSGLLNFNSGPSNAKQEIEMEPVGIGDSLDLAPVGFSNQATIAPNGEESHANNLEIKRQNIRAEIENLQINIKEFKKEIKEKKKEESAIQLEILKTLRGRAYDFGFTQRIFNKCFGANTIYIYIYICMTILLSTVNTASDFSVFNLLHKHGFLRYAYTVIGDKGQSIYISIEF